MAKFLACNMRQQRVPPVSGPYGYKMTDFIFSCLFVLFLAFSQAFFRSATAGQLFEFRFHYADIAGSGRR